MPKLTLVTICRNAEKTIRQTLESVASQRGISPTQVEHWVIDGASTDRTLEIVRSFPHVKWVSEKDRGISDAFNKGVERATGDWIQILNSDDSLAAPNTLAEVLPQLDPAYDFVYGRIALMDERLQHVLRYMGDDEGWRHLARRMTVPHPALFAHRRMFERHGLFDLTYKIAMDYEWLLRSHGRARFKFIPTLVTNFRSGGASASGADMRQAKECWRAKAKNRVANPVKRAGWFAYQSSRQLLDSSMPGVPVLGPAYEKLARAFRKNY